MLSPNDYDRYLNDAALDYSEQDNFLHYYLT